jgi:hypothetical protein
MSQDLDFNYKADVLTGKFIKYQDDNGNVHYLIFPVAGRFIDFFDIMDLEEIDLLNWGYFVISKYTVHVDSYNGQKLGGDFDVDEIVEELMLQDTKYIFDYFNQIKKQ